MSDFLSTGGEGNKFVEIEKEILAAVQAQVQANNYGLEVEFLGIKKLGLPESVTQSVFERMTSERQVLVSKSQYEGEAEAAEDPVGSRPQSGRAAGQRRRRRPRRSAARAKPRPPSPWRCSSRTRSWQFHLPAERAGESLKERSTLIFDQHTPPFDLFRGASTNLLNASE